MLSIPYLRKSMKGVLRVPSIRFRCVVCPNDNHEGHGKYLYSPGDHPRLFNTRALLQGGRWIAVSEGELDAITASGQGIPTVGLPGVTSWKPHFGPVFEGYEQVIVLADGDEPGRRLVPSLIEHIPQVRAIHMPDGEDVNSFVLNGGDLQDLIERGK